jgi:dTMP kinase
VEAQHKGIIDGMFITLEGIEGSGKTTQVNHIVHFMEKNRIDCVVTREPGGTLIGEKIRAILLDPENQDLDPVSELLLYAADRAQHLREKVVPILSSKKTVICDRFFDATIAYQGFARGLDMEIIQTLNSIVLDGLKPDMTILFDLPAATGLERAWTQLNVGTRTSTESRFEKETIEFHEKVRAGYLTLADKEPDRFKIVDASLDEIQVKNKIYEILGQQLRDKQSTQDID